jgi:hypothetical protein
MCIGNILSTIAVRALGKKKEEEKRRQEEQMTR